MNENKVIVPLPPRYIVEKIKIGSSLFQFEISWDQAKVLFACAVFLSIVTYFGDGWLAWGIDAVVVTLMAALFYRFAWTHEKLLESKMLYHYTIRKLKKKNNYSSIATPLKEIEKLYPYSIDRILPGGIIEFKGKKIRYNSELPN